MHHNKLVWFYCLKQIFEIIENFFLRKVLLGYPSRNKFEHIFFMIKLIFPTLRIYTKTRWNTDRKDAFLCKQAYLLFRICLPVRNPFHDTKAGSRRALVCVSQRPVTNMILKCSTLGSSHSPFTLLHFCVIVLSVSNLITYNLTYIVPYPVIILSGSTHSSQSCIHTPLRAERNLPPADWL